MASSSTPWPQNPLPILPYSGYTSSGWIAINTPRTLFAGRQSPDRARVQKGKCKTPVRVTEKMPPIEPHNTVSPQEGLQNLTPTEREEWEQGFDKVLQGGEDLEDDLPGLSDLPDLARTASKTPLRSSPCSPTPRCQARKIPGPSSKTCSQMHTVVIADSEDEDEDSDVIAEMEGHNLLARSTIPQYNMNVLGRVAAGDTNDGLSVRSRRRWPDWAERWHEDRLRPRHGNPRYLEAHPNNNWLLWGNNEVREADIDVRDEVVQDQVMESIETDYAPGKYDVERIADERRPGGHKFLVPWVGWEELEWIPARDCFCPDRIAEFRATQRANLLAPQIDGPESEAKRLRQLTEVARTAAERGDGPNPSLQRRAKNGRFARGKASGDEVNNKPAAVDLSNPQVESDAEDDDLCSRERTQRSNTAIRPKSRTLSVLQDTPQVPKDSEVLWVRSRTVTLGSAGSGTTDNRPLQLEPTLKEDEKAILKRVYQAKEEKKMEKLLNTVQKGSQQRQEGEDQGRANQEETARKAKLDVAGKHERKKRERNQAKRERRKAKQKRRRLSREKNEIITHDSDQGLQNRPLSSHSGKRATQDKIAAASAVAVAKEKARQKEMFSSHKTKNRKDRSASSMRRSESGDNFRALREQEHQAAAGPSALRPEFQDYMNKKQYDALLSSSGATSLK